MRVADVTDFMEKKNQKDEFYDFVMRREEVEGEE
jgi:hypothetical protein